MFLGNFLTKSFDEKLSFASISLKKILRQEKRLILFNLKHVNKFFKIGAKEFYAPILMKYLLHTFKMILIIFLRRKKFRPIFFLLFLVFFRLCKHPDSWAAMPPIGVFAPRPWTPLDWIPLANWLSSITG